MMAENYPLVSIIMPVFNEGGNIRDCLSSVLKFDYPVNKLEIIIVDGRSTDETVSVINSFIKESDNIKLIVNEKRIVPVAMNLGISKASGKYIIRLDAHSYYPENYVRELIKNAVKYNTDNIGTVCNTDVKIKNSVSGAIKFVLNNRFGVGNSYFRIGIEEPKEVDTVPFGCFTREVLQKVGGFDERLIRNQDIEINKRIRHTGGKILLIPEPRCTYWARTDFRSFSINNYNNGKWNILTSYFTSSFSSLSFRHFVPLIFLLSIIFSGAFVFLHKNFIFITAGIILSYLIALLIILHGSSMAFRQRLVTLLAFLVLHFSYGFGSLLGIFESIALELKSRMNGYSKVL